jgi:NAD(P)-dependent dehydrogenase (short-subunit alcohol dehydrogenase family)
MKRIFITGSAEGLGSLAAKQLTTEGYSVVLHARNAKRAHDALRQIPGAEQVLIADLYHMAEVKSLANQVNALGHFDAIIHNAGIYSTPPSRFLQ